MVTSSDLTAYQRAALASWYVVTRTSGLSLGYYSGQLHERRPTLEVLHRLGIVERPHRGIGDWCAVVTAEGVRLAGEAAVWEEWSTLADDERSPVHTIAARVHMETHEVAAIVFPSPIFGAWSNSDEPMEPLGEAALLELLDAELAHEVRVIPSPAPPAVAERYAVVCSSCGLVGVPQEFPSDAELIAQRHRAGGFEPRH